MSKYSIICMYTNITVNNILVNFSFLDTRIWVDLVTHFIDILCYIDFFQLMYNYF